MSSDNNGTQETLWLTQLFPLRVLGEYDKKYEVFVSYCVETGSVTTADDMDTAVDMMKEVLEDEISRALASKNFGNLFSTPAPIEVREKWAQLAAQNPTQIGSMKLNLKIPAGGKNARHASTEVAVLKAA